MTIDPQALIAEAKARLLASSEGSRTQWFKEFLMNNSSFDNRKIENELINRRAALTEAPAEEDERDDPANWPDGAPWLTPTPASTDARETLIATIDWDFVEIFADDGEGYVNREQFADAILAAGFILPVTRDDAKAEGFQWDYRTAFNGDTERRLVGPYEFFAATYRATSQKETDQ